MAVTRFGLALPATTEAQTNDYVRQVLDPQIMELQDQLQLLQGLRRAIAGTFGIDRRDDAGTFGQIADAATRAELEGGADLSSDGRLKPAGHAGPAALDDRLVPRDSAEPLRGSAVNAPAIVTKQSGIRA